MPSGGSWSRRVHHKSIVLVTVVALLGTLLAVVVPPVAARAVGTILFQNGFHNRTVDGTGTVTVPTTPGGTNQACLTASGNTANLPVLSCSGASDAQGSGKLRMTNASTNQVGGVFGATSFPSSNGLDVTFNTYQWGGGAADGMGFVLGAVDPANPVPPSAIGPSGGSLGYSPAGSISGLTNAYLGVGLDVYGNFSGTGFQGTGCTNATNITSQVPGAVVVRGPGNGRVGYCGLTTTWTGAAASKVTLRASTRAASVVPVQVLINPTNSSFTSDSGVVVSAGTYKVVVTPVGQSVRTLTGSLPAAASGLYPAASWTNANGVPKQLAFGFVGSTGSVTDAHEIDDVKVLTFNPVPQLAVDTTSYVAASPVPGAPVNYVVTSSVLTGSNETNAISVTQTTPVGVLPVGAYGTGWSCLAPVGRTVTCTTTATSFTNGTTLPVINVVGIVTASGMTAGTVQNASVTTVSSADGNPATDTVTTSGTVPAAPTGLSIAPSVGPVAGGGSVTISGTTSTAPTAIEIGTTAEQQAGTSVVLLPCQGSATTGCFTISGSNVNITSMPARTTTAAVTVTMVTLGVATSVPYTYADKPATIATPSATAGLTSAVLTWVVPAENGSAITGYRVTPYLAGVAQTVLNLDAAATTRTINGLVAGGSYTFRVAAVNAYGTSTASAASNAVTPYSAPTAPTISSVRAGTASAVLSWTAPTSTGGSAITGYVVTPYIGTVAQTPQTFTGTATTQTVTGLTPGTPYTFTVAAALLLGTNPLYRINAGGPVVTASDGGADWSADTAADSSLRNNGSLTSTDAGTVALDSTVPAGTPVDLFTTQRYDPGSKGNADEMKWTLPVTSGTNVKVRLYFANRYTGTGTVGARVFDVAIDGTTVLSNFDVVAASGADQTATMREFAVTSDGTINIDFGHEVENPLISAIEVIQIGLPSVGPASARSTAATPNQSPTLTFTAPPAGEVNVAYSSTLTVTNGTSPFVWSVSSGTLPAGLTLNASSGLLSGTPTASGSFAVTIRVVDASGQAATKAVTLVIADAPTVTFAPAAGEVTVAYSQQPTVTGGTGADDWEISAGGLPAGLAINPTTGLISGTPTASGSSSVTITVTDDFGQVASRTVTIVIAALPTITSTAPAAGQVGLAYSTTFSVAGGSTPLVWSVSTGSVPPGLSLSSSTGVLSGTPTTVGSSAFTVLVTDSFGKTTTKAVTLVVSAGPLVITKTANASSATAGSTVAYTITVSNTSTTAFTGVTLSDPLTGVLDDATYAGGASATTGVVSYSAPTLSWTGNVAAGATATISYSVTVSSSGAGNRVMTNSVSSTTLGTNCPGGGTDTRCTATVTVAGLSIIHTAGAPTTTPGSTVTFSIAVTNTGQTPYTGATFTENLSAMLDDASYATASATSGSVAYTNPTLSWSGNLAVGATATITYSLTVANPDQGNKSLAGTIVSPAAGSTCPSGNPAASCTATVTVLIPALTITTTTAGLSTTTPGSVVPYTVTVSNTGQTDYSGTAVSIALAAALDDATYNGNAAAGSGGVAFDAGTATLVWTGNLAVNATVTITASVTVRDPDPGNRVLTAVASSSAAGSTCPPGSANTACTSTVQVLVPALTISKSSSVTSTTPGSVVSYTVTVTNSGQTSYTGATFSDTLAGVVDDAVYNANAATTVGTVGYSGGVISWTGNLAIAATATITYSVTVSNPDNGNRSLTSRVTSATQGNNCPGGSSDTRCVSTVAVLIPGLTISTVADAATTTPGSQVRYTTTVVNSGETAYTGAVITLGFTGVADDASYNFDTTSTTGVVDIVGPDVVTWTITLAPGASATTSGTFTVNSPVTGNQTMTATANSAVAGSTCPTGVVTTPCSATVTVLIPGLTITKTADRATVVTGGSVVYTVSVVNSGQTTYTGAGFTDSLATVLTDAVYAGNAVASAGTVSYAAPTLSWTGALAVGATVTITYSVVVRDPDPGDKRMTNTVVSTSAGSNCASTSSDARCTAVVNVQVPGLTITKTANVSSTVPGAAVGFTVQVTNSGATVQTGATFVDSLSGVLDDATYAGGATATSGTVGYASSTLTWTGDLAVGASATISYTTTVKVAAGGSNRLTNTAVSTTRGSNCAAGSADPRCTADVPVARLVLERVPVPPATTTPGAVLNLSVRYTNVGQVPYVGITVDIPSADSSDDLVATGPDTATSGTLVQTTSTTQWTGSIPVAGSVDVAIFRTVRDPDTGNKQIRAPLQSDAPGSNCPTVGATDSRCTILTVVLTPGLTVSKAASASSVEPGGAVGYTITVRNSGDSVYPAATVSDSLSGVLDDAVFTGNATATGGAVSYSAPTLTWTGSLAVGATVTITYSVMTSNPGSGDKSLVNSVSSTEVGSSCPPGSGNSACSSSVTVLTPALTMVKSASTASTTLGATVVFTVSVTNSGQTSYPAAVFSDDLAAVLDDASYLSASTTANRGTVGYSGGVLSWSGGLAVGESATISYAVSVRNPSSGDLVLANTVTSTSAGSNCAVGSGDIRCTARVDVLNSVALSIVKTTSVASTVPGGSVVFTLRLTNPTDTTIFGATITDSLTNVLDDAAYASSTANVGTVAFTSPNLTWTGNVAARRTVTVTYTVTVGSAGTGDELLSATTVSTSPSTSNNCLPASNDPQCTATVPVAVLDIVQSVDLATATPGDLINATGTFTNRGQVDYIGISITLDTTDVTDDATPEGDTASSGSFFRSTVGLTWTGNSPVGDTVTTSRLLRVKNPDPGNKLLTATHRSDAPGNNCAPASTDPDCTFSVTVLLPALSISVVADRTFVVPAGVVAYNVTVANTGQTAYVGATVTDSLTGVLDDASYNANATASTGSLTYTSPNLTWSGDLVAGQSVTISFTVTAHRPADGDKTMLNRVSSSNAGSSCLPNSGNVGCTNTVAVSTPSLTTVITASKTTALPGDVLTYTVTATNNGQTDYTTATFNAPLSGLLDDADYGNNATATTGTVVRTGDALDWTGALVQGAQATITFSVTVKDPVPVTGLAGNHRLDQTISSIRNGSNCLAGSTDPRCSTSVPIASLRIVNTVDVATAKPTDVVRDTGTFTNTGQVPYVGITVYDSFVGALDNAAYNGDAAADSGSVIIVVGSGRIVWTGDVAVGQTVTITGSVTVNNPKTGNATQDTLITTDAPATNCPVGGTDPACRTSVAALTPALTVTKAASATTSTPGGTLTYTITATNTGQTSYTAARISDDLAGVLTESSYGGGAVASRGSVGLVGQRLIWTGDLGVGQNVVITYSLLVDNPTLGDKLLVNQVTSDELGSSCPTGGSGSACSSFVTVLVPALDIAIAASSTTTTPGSSVGYTLTITNTGQTSYLGAQVSASLLGVLDDAVYPGGASSSTGSTTFSEGALTWTGDLATGATAVITYGVMVDNPDNGNRTLTTSVSSAVPGSSCNAGSPCLNVVSVLIPGLAVSTQADRASATPGDVVTFTIRLQNTGQTPYLANSVSTGLGDVLDDATFDGTASASSGVVSYAAPKLSWTGDLAVGSAPVTITYRVTIKAPASGSKVLTTTVLDTAGGSTCPAVGAGPSCTATVTVLVPSLSIVKSADRATTVPGGVVRYTIRVENTGQTSYTAATGTAATISDALTDVLTDAAYNADAAVTGGGSLTYVGDVLGWTGDLLVGASATITYSVTVSQLRAGDQLLTNRAVSTVPGSSCRPDSTSPSCSVTVQVLIPALRLTKTADRSTVVAGQPVVYTVTVTNTGEVDYAPATFTDPLTDVLDDASYPGGATATVGTVSLVDDTLAWTGALARGATAIVTYSVTTNYPATGDKSLGNRVFSASAGASCSPASTDPACRSAVTVQEPALTITKTADVTTVVAGGAVRYTIEATNTGEADYPSVTLTDPLTDVLLDAAYNTDATATTGSLGYAADTLSWSGALAKGASVLISYSVTADLVIADGASLANRVSSDAVGSTCVALGASPSCVATVAVQARVVGISGLTPSFTLTGLPGETVEQEGAVGMTVYTNSSGGYSVTVRATDDVLRASATGNDDTIPSDALAVRDGGQTLYEPLTRTPFTVHTRNGPSAPGGDAVSNDYQVTIPFVASDTYSTTVDYIVTAQ